MPFPTKVQHIARETSQQWYISIPSAMAQGLDMAKGEDVEWTIADKGHLVLSRKVVPPNPVDVKKTLASEKKSNR